jgi:hypothetical protein
MEIWRQLPNTGPLGLAIGPLLHIFNEGTILLTMCLNARPHKEKNIKRIQGNSTYYSMHRYEVKYSCPVLQYIVMFLCD